MACATLKRTLDWDSVLGGGPSKRRRYGPHHPCTSPTRDWNSSSPVSTPRKPSAFPDVSHSRMTPEHMAENIKAEFRMMQRRKYMLRYLTENSDSSSSEGSAESTSQADKPMFTFKEVGIICEKMLKERESEIREEYDTVLNDRLEDQYNAFVKFTYEHIHRTYTSQSAPSYLS